MNKQETKYFSTLQDFIELAKAITGSAEAYICFEGTQEDECPALQFSQRYKTPRLLENNNSFFNFEDKLSLTEHNQQHCAYASDQQYVTPILNKKGERLGVLCVQRSQFYKNFSQHQKEMLAALSRCVTATLEHSLETSPFTLLVSEESDTPVPICASCKDVKAEQGKWISVEQYILYHTKRHFTHSICPECSQKLYSKAVDTKATNGHNS